MTFQEYCNKYNITLSEQQQKAMLREKGETLLLAVPGSGKTTVIVARTGYLIHCLGVDPNKIVTITYSKAAALEMKERYRLKFNDNTVLPKFSTIHSLCVSIIRYASKTHGINIKHLEPDNKRIIRRALYESTKVWPSEFCVKHLALLITKAKNRMMSNEEIESIKCLELSNEFARMSFSEFYILYHKYMTKNNLMDFDDQLLLAYSYLLAYKDVRCHFQNAYPYIGVDESQDTSLIQFEIIHILASGGKSLFVVGDDDQSIYGFRGAEPANILHFADSYPNAEIMYMETNYRSSKDIVNAADSFIKGNRMRYDKTATAARKEPGEIVTTRYETEEGIYTALMRRITEIKDKKETLAIMSRSNYMLLPVVDKLTRANITVRRRDNFESLFTHPTVSGIINVLTLSVEPWNIAAFRHARTTMKTYISNKHMAIIEKMCENDSNPPEKRDIMDIAINVCCEEAYIRRALINASTVLRRVAEASPTKAIDLAVQKFSKNIDSEDLPFDNNINVSTLYIGALKCIAENFKDLPPFLKTIKEYSESTTDTRSINSNVTLTTIHSAKGLEFDNVILIDAIEGILPQETFDDKDEDVEEEARLFYVALTRAKNRVDFFVPRNLFGVPVEQSHFIRRMETRSISGKKGKSKAKKKSDTCDFAIGDYVRHPNFGEGIVIAFDDDIVDIRFDKHGEKRILASFCKHI